MIPFILAAIGGYFIADGVTETKKFEDGGKTDSKGVKLKFSDLKKGDYLKRKNRSILLKVLSVDSSSATLYNDVTDDKFNVIDLSEYEKHSA